MTGIWPGTGLAPIPEDELAVVGGALHGGLAHQGRAQRVRLGLKKLVVPQALDTTASGIAASPGVGGSTGQPGQTDDL